MEIPGLASIFFGPLARLLRLRREQRKPHHTRRARPAIQFQPLEPRVLLSADLIGTVQWDPGAAALFPDADAEAAVLVQNIGDRSAKSVKVSVYASADEVLDASDVLLGTDHTRGKLRPGAAQEVRVDLDFDEDLRPGEYQLLALVDSRDKVRESDESNNLALGPVFDFGWIFGDLPGCEGSDTLTFRDADGTKVTLRLDGPGVGELTWDGSGWDLQLTGTDGRSELSILTNRGGDGRFAIDDIHVAGSLDALFAPKTDLTGILAIDGRLDRGLVIGSATDAIIAVPSIGASKDHWHDRWSGHDRGHGRHDRHGDRDSGVTGIAVLGNLENSQILVGANLGADGQPGGEGDDADQFGSGRLGNLLIAGSMLSSAVRVGQDPVDGIFDNGDDVLEYGSIRSITIVGEMSDDSRVVAAGLPRYAFVDRHFVKTAVDPRFIDELGDEVAPGVTIDQAAGQADPTNESPIEFTVLFSEEVFGFGAEDIDFSGSTVGGELVASVMGSGASYTVSVSGMTSSGLVVASIGAGAAADAAGNLSEASTSSDNTVTLSVGADNDAPVAGDDAFSTAEDVARLITAAELLANDTDVDGDTLTIASFTQAAHGTVVDHLDGTYTYTPNQDFNGADSFSYTVTDGAGGTDTATVTLSVGADNDAPVLDLIADQGVLVNQLLSIQASATDPDGPGDTLTFSLVGTVPTGAAITTDGLFTWTPTPTAYGTTPITVRVTDSGTPGLFDEDTFDVTVIAPPRVAIDDVLLVEPDDGQTALAVFRVMLSGPAPVGVSVSYANIATFNATPGVDFVAGSGTLTFDPGETEKTFSITVLGDASIEGDERFAYDIFSPVNAVLSGKQQGFADILDDDGETRVGIERRTAMEGDSGTTTAVFDVLLSSPSASTVTVDYATVAFQATAGVDYVAASGTLTFAPGETAKTVSVEIIGDTITDGDERFTVLLTNPTNATISGLSQDLNAFIVDDDGPGLMVATSIGSGDSGGDMPDAAQLEATLDAAVTLWTQALGADDPRLAQLAGLTIGVADFSGAALGSLDGGAILIDADAAGHGWFVDLTPAGNSEYRLSADAGMLSATPRSDAFGRMDLLTVVLHEIGHVLGFDHEDAASYAVMRDELSAGVRYTTAAPKFDLDAPWAGARKAAIAWDDWGSGWAPAHKPRVAHLGRTFADFLFSR